MKRNIGVAKNELKYKKGDETGQGKGKEGEERYCELVSVVYVKHK